MEGGGTLCNTRRWTGLGDENFKHGSQVFGCMKHQHSLAKEVLKLPQDRAWHAMSKEALGSRLVCGLGLVYQEHYRHVVSGELSKLPAEMRGVWCITPLLQLSGSSERQTDVD